MNRRAERPVRPVLPSLLVALLIAALLAGCANVPTGGRVISAKPSEQAEPVDDPYVRIVPVRPGRGWRPEDIISGFLSASASFDDGHRVARDYLLGAATEWNPAPRPSVIVYSRRDQPEVLRQTDTEASVRVQAFQVGRIGRDGQYVSDQRSVAVVFQLTKNTQGQWRVAQLPEELTGGLLLSQGDVDRAFRILYLYYFDPDRQVLVPDPVFLPLGNRQELAGQLVRALLSGPTSWLRPSVRSTFPAGTALVGDVRIGTDGIAAIDLNAAAGKGDAPGMSAQLVWTLHQLPEIKGVRIRAGDRTLTPEGAGAVQTTGDWSAVNLDSTTGIDGGAQTAYLRGPGGQLHRLQGDHVERLAAIEGSRLHRPAVSLDFRHVAGLDESRTELLAGVLTEGSGSLETVLLAEEKGTKLTPPSWDRDGTLWTVESKRDKSVLWVRERGAEPVRVRDWGLGGREVLALRVAWDGVRAAAIVKVEGRTQIQLGRITRAPGSPPTAQFFLPVNSELAEATDLAWSNSGMLAVLGRDQGGPQLLPYFVSLAGGSLIPMTGIGALGEPSSIAAAPNSPVLIGTELTGKEAICRQRNFRDRYSEWNCALSGSAPAYPG